MTGQDKQLSRTTTKSTEQSKTDEDTTEETMKPTQEEDTTDPNTALTQEIERRKQNILEDAMRKLEEERQTTRKRHGMKDEMT